MFSSVLGLYFSATGAISSNAGLRWSIDSGARERISSPIYSILFSLAVFTGLFPFARDIEIKEYFASLILNEIHFSMENP